MPLSMQTQIMMIGVAQSHHPRSYSTVMSNDKALLSLQRPKLDFRAKSERSEGLNKRGVYSSLLNTVIVPPDIIKTAADFWRLNINALHSEDKLEIGVAIYLSMIATDRSVRYLFKQHYKIKQEQIERLSLKFLDMICWLIQSLWSRNDNDLTSQLSKLGTVHKAICIKVTHFNIMLKSVHEQLKFYFPVRYRIQEEYAMDYIFAYSAEIMMSEPLSTKTKSEIYYKTLELKFNSEKKKNDFRKQFNKTGLKISQNISAPVYTGNKVNKAKIKVMSKTASTPVGVSNKIKITINRFSPHMRPKLHPTNSNSFSVGLITPTDIS